MSIRYILYGVTYFFCLVGASLGLDAYFTYRDLLKPRAFLSAPPQPPRIEPVAPAYQKNDYAVIVRRNLFTSDTLLPGGTGRASSGVSSQSPPPAQQPRGAVPKPLAAKFRLAGTTVFPEGGGYAILEDIGSKQQSVHRQGDRIQDVLIQEVRRGEIRLEVGSRFEVLRAFEKDEKEATGALARRPAPATLPGSPPSAARVPRVLPRAQIARLVQSVEQMKSQFRAESYQAPEGETGVRVFPLLASGVMRMLGIQAGDVVLAVDGNPLKSEEELHNALGQMLGRGEAEIAVLRSGKKLSLSFRIQ